MARLTNETLHNEINLVKQDVVHVMFDGKIVKTGDAKLALEVENKGYDWLEV